MAPQPVDLHGRTFADETPEQSAERVRQRFEDVGLRLMNRFQSNPPLSDGRKRAYAAQMLGEAFVTAYNAMLANKEGVNRVADAVAEKKEIYGDDLLHLLDHQKLVKPEIDWTAEESWPPIVWSKRPDERPKDAPRLDEAEGLLQ